MKSDGPNEILHAGHQVDPVCHHGHDGVFDTLSPRLSIMDSEHVGKNIAVHSVAKEYGALASTVGLRVESTQERPEQKTLRVLAEQEICSTLAQNTNTKSAKTNNDLLTSECRPCGSVQTN